MLINEFGDIGIDSQLLVSYKEDPIDEKQVVLETLTSMKRTGVALMLR